MPENGHHHGEISLSHQLDYLTTKVAELAENSAAYKEKYSLLNNQIEDLRKDIKDLNEAIGLIKNYASKWQGGFYVLLTLGSIASSMIIFWDKLKSLFWMH